MKLPAPFAPLQLTRYIPVAVVDQTVEPTQDKDAPPAIELSIDGPTQSHQRWLVADDPDRNRLTSFIGTWRYMAIDDRSQRDHLYEQFRTEFTRPPILNVASSTGDHAHTFPATVGSTTSLADLECTVRVLKFFPHFAYDETSKQPVNQSDRRLNPAVLLELARDGAREERWVFSQFPDYEAQHGSKLPFRARLDCPVERTGKTPDFVVVTTGRVDHEVWTRHETHVSERTLALDEHRDIPGSRYTFHLRRFVPAGRLEERYRPSDGQGGVAAIRIESTDVDGSGEPIWLALGKPRRLRTIHGPVSVTFSTQPTTPRNGH